MLECDDGVHLNCYFSAQKKDVDKTRIVEFPNKKTQTHKGVESGDDMA